MSNKSLLEDLFTIGSEALGGLAGSRAEIRERAKRRLETITRALDLVSREEFDAAFAMAAKARDAQEELAARLAQIEDQLNLSRPKNKVKRKSSPLPSVKTKQYKRTTK